MVDVNVVYRTVLYILNKEQRGFLTPAEFNKVAEQVQLEIFEQYFEDLNQLLRVPQTDNEYANRQKQLEQKISIFETYGNSTYVAVPDPANPPPNARTYTLPSDMHRLGTISYKDKALQEMQRNEYLLAYRSPLTRPTEQYPAFYASGTGSPDGAFTQAAPTRIKVFPDTITENLPTYYVRRPKSPVWAYTINADTGGYVYQGAADSSANPTTGSVQFELDSSEQVSIILNILMYSGIIIRDPSVVQAASALAQQDEQNEKS